MIARLCRVPECFRVPDGQRVFCATCWGMVPRSMADGIASAARALNPLSWDIQVARAVAAVILVSRTRMGA